MPEIIIQLTDSERETIRDEIVRLKSDDSKSFDFLMGCIERWIQAAYKQGQDGHSDLP